MSYWDPAPATESRVTLISPVPGLHCSPCYAGNADVIFLGGGGEGKEEEKGQTPPHWDDAHNYLLKSKSTVLQAK